MSEFDNPEVYRSVLENLPTGVLLVDQKRRILFWNAGAEHITGYLSQNVVGRFLREHLLSTREEVKDVETDPVDPLMIAFRDGKPSSGYVSILHKQGYRVPIVLHTVPIRDSHGSVIGVAECFDTNLAATERTRRQFAVAGLGCLDEITGIPARSFMEPHLREQLKVFAEKQIPFAILLIEVDELDHFRRNLGRSAIPNILRVVVQTVENSLRPTDIVGCWYDDRFIAVLKECRESSIESVANRIRKMVAQSEVEWWGDQFPVTASFGGAGSREDDTLETLLDRAMKSLTESSAAGGNHVTVVR